METVETVETSETVETVETEKIVETVEIDDTVETVLADDLKKSPWLMGAINWFFSSKHRILSHVAQKLLTPPCSVLSSTCWGHCGPGMRSMAALRPPWLRKRFRLRLLSLKNTKLDIPHRTILGKNGTIIYGITSSQFEMIPLASTPKEIIPKNPHDSPQILALAKVRVCCKYQAP